MITASSILKSVAPEPKAKKTKGCHWIGPFTHVEYELVCLGFEEKWIAPKDLKALLLAIGNRDISIFPTATHKIVPLVEPLVDELSK